MIGYFAAYQLTFLSKYCENEIFDKMILVYLSISQLKTKTQRQGREFHQQQKLYQKLKHLF